MGRGTSRKKPHDCRHALPGGAEKKVKLLRESEKLQIKAVELLFLVEI